MATIKAGKYRFNDEPERLAGDGEVALPFYTDKKIMITMIGEDTSTAEVVLVDTPAPFATIKWTNSYVTSNMGSCFKIGYYYAEGATNMFGGPSEAVYVSDPEQLWNLAYIEAEALLSMAGIDKLPSDEIKGYGQTITIAEDTEVDDTFAQWFTANAVQQADEPPTAEGVKSKLQSLITASNAKTGKSDANLTDAVNTLIEGYGSGDGIFAEEENEHGTTIVLGADLQEKTIDITANGTVEVTPDEGYALKKVTANVDVKGNDKIQRYIELNGNSAAYLFYNFKGASVDELLDGIDTSKATSTKQMFANCSGITSVPTIDTGNSTDFSYMFAYDANLKTVPLLDSTKVTAVDSMFYQCKALTDVPLFDTSKATNFASFFAQCESLKVIPAFDLRSSPIYSAFSSIVWRCYALTECWFRNIKHNIQVSDGSSWGHLLTVESLLHLCKECRMSTQARALTMGTANLAKLEGIYVKLIDITDEMRAEDDLIDEKHPFAQCESTDEGAMTIQDYMATKKWSLA